MDYRQTPFDPCDERVTDAINHNPQWYIPTDDYDASNAHWQEWENQKENT